MAVQVENNKSFKVIYSFPVTDFVPPTNEACLIRTTKKFIKKTFNLALLFPEKIVKHD